MRLLAAAEEVAPLVSTEQIVHAYNVLRAWGLVAWAETWREGIIFLGARDTRGRPVRGYSWDKGQSWWVGRPGEDGVWVLEPVFGATMEDCARAMGEKR